MSQRNPTIPKRRCCVCTWEYSVKVMLRVELPKREEFVCDACANRIGRAKRVEAETLSQRISREQEQARVLQDQQKNRSGMH